jgi:hypothetical protein
MFQEALRELYLDGTQPPEFTSPYFARLIREYKEREGLLQPSTDYSPNDQLHSLPDSNPKVHSTQTTSTSSTHKTFPPPVGSSVAHAEKYPTTSGGLCHFLFAGSIITERRIA